jgi:zinc transport system permease protein
MLDLLRQDFIQRALLAGMGLSLSLGIMGCFMLWRRLAFFSDAMGHAALLGVVIGVLGHLQPQLGVIGVSLGAALILSSHRSSASRFPLDTWLGAVSYGGLALGLCLMALYPAARLNPDTILFGEILSLTWTDLIWVLGMAMVTPVLFWIIWRPLLLITLNEDLAATMGIPVRRIQGIFLGSVALVTAVGLKITGALLLPALMIFPAATASCLARSPESMAIFSMLIAMVSFITGSLVSFAMDTPTGPTIVLVSLGFMISGAFLSRQGRG